MELNKHRSNRRVMMVLTGLLLTGLLVGCHQKQMVAQVGTHTIKVSRHMMHFSNTDYTKGSFYKYAESSPVATFEFTVKDERVAVNGHELGMLKPNDEIRVDDDGVTVKNAEKNAWLDHGQTRNYLAENAKQVTAKK